MEVHRDMGGWMTFKKGRMKLTKNDIKIRDVRD